jgi:predicted permease
MLIDLRHLWRNLRRSRASAAAAVLTLTLTLGAGASILAVVDAVLLTPPPFTDPGALYAVREAPIDEPAVAVRQTVTYATFDAWRERAPALAAFEAFDGTNLTLTGIGSAERVRVTDSTPGLLALLGVSPLLGRTFVSDDVGRPVAILSHAFWRSRLGADPNAIGLDIVLGNRPHTVVGVLPERFVFALGVADIWRPFAVSPAQAMRDGARVLVIARLNRAATPSQVAATLDDVSRASTPPSRVVVTRVATAIAGDRATTLALLAGAVGLAMVIAFANLAGLMLVRSIDRRRELAVRTALGARRSDIVRQLVLEAGVIVTLGAIGGLWLGWWMTPVITDLLLERAPGQPAIADPAINWRVTGVLIIVAGACACICGSLAALSARRNVVDVLRRRATPTARELGVRRAFVVGEVALACVLLVSMSLLGKSLFTLLAVDPGFDAGGVLVHQVSLPRATYRTGEQAAGFYSSLQSALRERLGPRVAAIVDELPLTGYGRRRLVGARPGDPGREAIVRSASPDYFEVMRIPVLAGRTFEPGDNAVVAPRVVISKALADRVFASESPVGRQIWLVPQAVAAEIIGVVGDVTHRALDDAPMPTMYESSLQEPSHSSVVVVRSSRPDAAVIAVVREEVARLDPRLPVYGVRPLAEVVSASPGLPTRRLVTAAFTAFALLALVLSTIGLFGVAAHDVACRRAELGLRIALGADPMRLLLRTLRQGALMVAGGLAVGSVLSAWVAGVLSGMVFAPTGPLDLFNFGLAAAVLMMVGLLAVLPAAQRAARTSPLSVLQGE